MFFPLFKTINMVYDLRDTRYCVSYFAYTPYVVSMDTTYGPPYILYIVPESGVCIQCSLIINDSTRGC